jgi:hypothetical protein
MTNKLVTVGTGQRPPGKFNTLSNVDRVNSATAASGPDTPSVPLGGGVAAGAGSELDGVLLMRPQ